MPRDTDTGFKIEKGVPLPAERANAKYPWRRMEKGDSFFVPGYDAKAHSSLSGLARAQAQRIGNGTKFTARRVDGGIRVWRVS